MTRPFALPPLQEPDILFWYLFSFESEYDVREFCRKRRSESPGPIAKGCGKKPEGSPVGEYETVRRSLGEVMGFLEDEGSRLEAKILERGGLEPGRMRRSTE